MLHCSKIPNIFQSILFSMFILTSNLFLQNSPRQSLQAATHFSPLRKHELIRETHVFFDDVLQLHRMKFSILPGAGSRSVFISCKLSFIWYQPQSSRFKHLRSKELHWQTCEWTLKHESVLVFQMEANFWAWELKKLPRSP